MSDRLTDAQPNDPCGCIGLCRACHRGDHDEHIAGDCECLPCALAASPVASRQAPREDEGLRIEVVPAGEIAKGDDVLVTGTLGAVRKTVFSTMSSEEDGCALTFTDADSFVLPGLDYMVVRVVAAAPVVSREDEGLREAADA